MRDTSRHAISPWGLPIALAVMGAWGGHLAWLLWAAPLAGPLSVRAGAHALLQAFLFTGLFITGHDAMHGSVHPSRRINRWVGTLACFLFAGLSYRRLVVNHRRHHLRPTADDDPDFSPRTQAFWPWLGRFMVRYTTLVQLAVMALAYNLLVWAGAPEWRVWAFWVLPAVLGTLQLFTFGTYLPHRRASHAQLAPHHARSLPRNHALAFLTCYFFGYHWEHHASPATPWWRLWRVKDARAAAAAAP